jgi:uncharacterized protein
MTMAASTKDRRTTHRIPTPTGELLDAWVWRPREPARGVVVMAHGIGGIKNAGLAPFAEHFAANGLVAIAFDYRHWGASEGTPRELLSLRRQRADYRAVLAWVAADPDFGALPRFIWGTSFAGMHIVSMAATEAGLSGAVAQCPLVDGFAAALRVPPARSLRLMGLAVADRVGSLLGRAPIYLPVSVAPGERGVIATADSLTGLERLTPTDGDWPNRITARSLLSFSFSRPARRAASVRCPILMVVGEEDTMAPTRPATQVAARAPRGELYRSRGGHYDVYAGGLDHSNVLRVETEFLLRCAEEASRVRPEPSRRSRDGDGEKVPVTIVPRSDGCAGA